MQTKYTTSDIYLASYLIYRGHSVNELEEIKPRKYVFVLDKPKADLDADITDFYQRRASIEPMEYVTALKQLKSLVYNETNTRYPANQPVRS